jgi:predicted P-loop ATPase
MTAAPHDTFAVQTQRQRLWARGYRPIAIWNADETVDDKGEPLKNPGKQPRDTWRTDAAATPPKATLSRPDARALNTGILTGQVVGIDIDVLREDVVGELVAMLEERLGTTPLVRIGQPPKTLLLYQAKEPFSKISTPSSLAFPDGTSAKIEILADGQQFVAFGTHPKTRAPYTWRKQTPETVPLSDLPIITYDAASEVVKYAENILRAAGAVTEIRDEEPESEPKQNTQKPRKNGEDANFFDHIKREAMADLAAWVSVLFPRAKRSPNGAYRISSKELGRDLEEDLSIHPGGIQDFGTEEKLTAIDVVINFGPADTPYQAACWLADKLGLSVDGTKQKARRDREPEPEPEPEIEPDEEPDAPIPPPDWVLDSKRRKVPNSQKNVRLALAQLRATLRHDLFAGRSLITIDRSKECALDDPILERLWLTIDERFGFRPSLDFFSIVLRDAARQNAFHPVIDYLDGLKWDGIKRIDDWLFTYGKTPKREEKYNNYVRKVGRIMLVAAVRRLRQPGAKFDEIMVFVNQTQGTDKSTALATLATRPEWFTDSIDLGAKDKEAIEQQQGKWIVEIPEMRGRRRNDADRIKAFLSRSIDRARLAYGRLPTEVPRQCVYFGSANDVKFLRDRSGNRRFWPIVGVKFDVAALRRDIHQLWAEAVTAERTDESIRLPAAMWSIAETVQTESLEEEPWVESLSMALDGLEGKIRAASVWLILEVDIARRSSDADLRMGAAMRELGWERKQRRYGGDPEWSYIKGKTEAQITVTRDPETRMVKIRQGERWWTIADGEDCRVDGL